MSFYKALLTCVVGVCLISAFSYMSQLRRKQYITELGNVGGRLLTDRSRLGDTVESGVELVNVNNRRLRRAVEVIEAAGFAHERIRLVNSSISGDGLKCLSQLPNVQELHIEGDISYDTLSQLKTLRFLRSLSIEVGENGVPSLKFLNHFPSLDVLYLTFNGGGLECLSELTAIRSVFVTGIGIDDADLAAIHSVLFNVRGLSLSSCPVTDRGLLCLDRFPNIDHLNLSHTSIGDATLNRALKLSNLETLLLKDTEITSDAVDEIAKGTLRVVQVRAPSVTEQSIDRLRERLKHAKVL